MSWLPSWQGILVSLAAICVIRAVWIWRKYDDHRFLRFIDWPRPYDNLDAKEHFWTFGTSRSEVERALSPAYARRYGWLMTVRARRFIIVVNAISWIVVIYGGFDLEVVDQVPILPPPNEHNERYLATKREKLGHRFPG